MLEGERMHLGAGAAAEVLGKHEFVAVLVRAAGGRLHADVGGDATEHDRANAPASQLQIEAGAIEGTPLVLGDDEVARRGWLRELVPARRQARIVGWLVYRCLQGIGEVGEKDTRTHTTGAPWLRRRAARRSE